MNDIRHITFLCMSYLSQLSIKKKQSTMKLFGKHNIIIQAQHQTLIFIL